MTSIQTGGLIQMWRWFVVVYLGNQFVHAGSFLVQLPSACMRVLAEFRSKYTTPDYKRAPQ